MGNDSSLIPQDSSMICTQCGGALAAIPPAAWFADRTATERYCPGCWGDVRYENAVNAGHQVERERLRRQEYARAKARGHIGAVLTVGALLWIAALLPSCGMVRDAQEVVADLKAASAEIKAAAVAADADKSGDTSLPEWIAWLSAGGGAALLLTLKRLFGAVAEQDAKRSQTAKELHGRVNEILTVLPAQKP